jgi:site-specific DNA recombinase
MWRRKIIFVKTKQIMKVIIYGRVSTYSQDVERQIEELKEYCKYSKYEIVKVFTETISGIKSREERKQISKLLEYVENNPEVNGVLVWELSRLGRKTHDILDIINQLTLKRIWIYSKKENLFSLNPDGTENPTSNLLMAILSSVSTLERETIVSRSVSGLRNTILKGNYVGGAFLPFGYKREEKRLVLDEEEEIIIKKIFKMYLEGNGTTLICNELNRLKIQTRYNKTIKGSITINKREVKATDFKWREGTIYSILTNTIYTGTKLGKRNIKGIKLIAPRIISDEVFSSVQTKLKSIQKTKTSKFFYLFDKMIKCGVCGRSYHPHKRMNNKDNRYICLSKRYQEGCSNYGIGIPKMNDGVWSMLRNNKDEIENILDINNQTNDIENDIKKLEENKLVLKKELHRIENHEKKLVELFLEDSIDKELYLKNFNNIKNEQKKYENELNDCLLELETKRKFKEKQSNINHQLRGIKDSKRILKRTIKNVVSEIIIYPVENHNLSEYIKFNKQDKFVLVELYTYLNQNKPLCFVISQRSQFIITPDSNEYNKETKTLLIGGEYIEGEEEEAGEINLKKLFHLSSLD